MLCFLIHRVLIHQKYLGKDNRDERVSTQSCDNKVKFTMFIQQWWCCLVSLWQHQCLSQVHLLSPKCPDDCYVTGSVKSEGEARLQRSWRFIKRSTVCWVLSFSLSLCFCFSLSISLYLVSLFLSLCFVTKSEKIAMCILERDPLSGAELVSLLVLFFLLASRIVRKHISIVSIS